MTVTVTARIDLTAIKDLGVRLIIEATTDAAMRRRIETDPVVVDIVRRAAVMPADVRRRVHETYWSTFAIHRLTQSFLRHRIRHAGGVTARDMRVLSERIYEVFGCRGTCGHGVTCPSGFALAIDDAIYAHLAGDLMDTDERRLFTAPWDAGAGEG